MEFETDPRMNLLGRAWKSEWYYTRRYAWYRRIINFMRAFSMINFAAGATIMAKAPVWGIVAATVGITSVVIVDRLRWDTTRDAYKKALADTTTLYSEIEAGEGEVGELLDRMNAITNSVIDKEPTRAVLHAMAHNAYLEARGLDRSHRVALTRAQMRFANVYDMGDDLRRVGA